MLLKGIDRVYMSLLTESLYALDIHGFHGKGSRTVYLKSTELLCLGRGDALDIAC